MTASSPTKVCLYLESGFSFSGIGYGDFSTPRSGEFVFCTAMSGIEESLTDPSFSGQILVNTVSHVGNTGFSGEDQESSQIWAEGLVCRHLEMTPSSWRAKTSLSDWILSEKRFVVEGVDTRELTTLLRETGSQRGIVVDEAQEWDQTRASEFIKTKVPSMRGRDLTSMVTCRAPYSIQPSDEFMSGFFWPVGREFAEEFGSASPQGYPAREIAVWDFGVKRNTLRMLVACGSKVNVLPSHAKAEEILKAGRDGVLLSNGPGDPAAATQIISELKKVIGRREIFSICLGHQLVALAAGAKTYKMKFGHRGIHHPVTQLSPTGAPIRTWITSQNHGFAVDAESLPKTCHISFVHADDQSVEGLSLPELRCETVQFHPEAAPGPTDSAHLIRQFILRIWRQELSLMGEKSLKSKVEDRTV